MNARQKAKKYKHLYEALLKQTPPIVFEEPHHVETLRCERCYSEEFIRNTRFIQEGIPFFLMKDATDFIASTSAPNATAIIQKDIAQGLAAGLDKYIVYRQDYDPEMNVYRICGELKVVVM